MVEISQAVWAWTVNSVRLPPHPFMNPLATLMSEVQLHTPAERHRGRGGGWGGGHPRRPGPWGTLILRPLRHLRRAIRVVIKGQGQWYPL